MGESSATLHESTDKLKPETIDRHRAIVSLMEELEAIDWYDQRVDAAGDPELRAILAHNRDEEKEHAAMTLEWLRRHDPKLDEHLKTYLYAQGSVLAVEAAAEKGGAGSGETGGGSAGSLGIGSLRGMEKVDE
jgi:ferritin-like protein